jgi:hypothetical protein
LPDSHINISVSPGPDLALLNPLLGEREQMERLAAEVVPQLS